MHILRLLPLILCCSLLSALEVGEQAPDLGAATWLKGSAPALADGEQWTVIEFWATWCGPCRTSIPHLSSLQDQYADLITIAGLSNEPVDTVRPFVEDMGADMDYAVAADAQSAHASYMQGIQGIPHAFLVEPGGMVVWHGHPMELDPLLAQVADGSLDVDRIMRLAPLEADLQRTLRSNDIQAVQSAADALLAEDPDHLQAIQVLLSVANYQGDPAAYRAVLDDLPIDSMPASTAIELAWLLIGQDDLQWRPLDHIQALAERAATAAPDRSGSLELRARAAYLVGDLDAAIKLQQRGLEAAPDPQPLQAGLDYYRRARSLAHGGSGTPPAPADDASNQSDPARLP